MRTPMDQDFREMLADELAGMPEPPVGDLVEASVRAGRRMRVARRARICSVAAAVVVLAGVAGSGVSFARSGGVTRVPVASATEVRTNATPAGVLELLIRTLPPGTTGDYAGRANNGGESTVQTFLDTGRGRGMIRLSVGPGDVWDSQARTDAELRAQCYSDQNKGKLPVRSATCVIAHDIKVGKVVTSPDGIKYQVTTISDNCIESTIVTVQQPGGTRLTFTLPTCLAWDGKQNKPSPAALTVEQAVNVGRDPRWGTELDPTLVAAGEKHFPHLSTEIGQ
jgi:hypothetical protein